MATNQVLVNVTEKSNTKMPLATQKGMDDRRRKLLSEVNRQLLKEALKNIQQNVIKESGGDTALCAVSFSVCFTCQFICIHIVN